MVDFGKTFCYGIEIAITLNRHRVMNKILVRKCKQKICADLVSNE